MFLLLLRFGMVWFFGFFFGMIFFFLYGVILLVFLIFISKFFMVNLIVDFGKGKWIFCFYFYYFFLCVGFILNL